MSGTICGLPGTLSVAGGVNCCGGMADDADEPGVPPPEEYIVVPVAAVAGTLAV
jgi:hypothetical protein